MESLFPSPLPGKHQNLDSDGTYIYLYSYAEPVTYETVYNYLKEIGVHAPEVVTAQSVLETGFYKSLACTAYNNLFGMGVRKTEPVDVCGKTFLDGTSMAVYCDWKQACRDYKNWQSIWMSKKGLTTISNYYQFLQSIPYAEDPNYCQKLQNLVNKLF